MMKQIPGNELRELVGRIAGRARLASLDLATVDRERKDACLMKLAELLESHQDTLLKENARDVEAARLQEVSGPILDRLTFTPERILRMAAGVREVALLPDPVGDLLESKTRPNGLEIRKVRVPIGVVAVIYESRPNVTIDCAALCLKSGNASILRGGKEAFHTNIALAGFVTQALEQTGLTPDAVQIVPTTDRLALTELLKLDHLVHCVIPRGGESLIRFVVEQSRIPVIKHYAGVCSVYVDQAADLEMAERVVVNAKTQRPGVCNAAENLFVHRSVAPDLLPRLGRALIEFGVELRVDPEGAALMADLPTLPATEEDFYEEFLDRILAIKVVDSVEAAINCINTYGSGHSDAIVTADQATAQKFLQGVDSATVYWNASTRFTDGYEFGLGAEIGISTDRLHCRGPMGLNELCTYKYHIIGSGQIRE